MNTIGAMKKLTAEQAATWNWLLRAIDLAETQSLVARGKARADGYLLGLRDAKVIDQADLEALEEAATTRETAGAHRTEPKTG